MNFETDVYEQIKEMSCLPTLDKAARLAGQQLELMKPAAMVPAKEHKLYIGPVAYVDRGHILIVLANGKRVMTIHVVPGDGFNTSEMLRAAVDYAKEVLREFWYPALSAKTGEEALKKYGGKPGKRCPETHPQVAFQIVGALFACCSDEKLRDLGKEIDELRKADICPSVVYLIGPGASGKKDTYSMATMLLPIAPYVESVIDG